MRRTILLGAPALAAALALATAAAAAEPPANPPSAARPGDAGADPMLAAGTESIAPGLAGRWATSVGNWKTSTKSMKDPKVPPTTSAGTAVSTLIMGGRHIREEIRGDFMGQPFEGMAVTGFDDAKKKYVTVWIDNQGTGILLAEGDVDATGYVLTQRTTYDDPVTRTRKTARWVTRLLGPDRKVFEWWDTGADGKEWMTMEVTYTRVK